MLGIAVVTYRRHKVLKRTLAAIAKHTREPYKLVIAEDGGADGTVRWCRRKGYTVVTGENKGVSWNKNRGLFALAAQGCDPILLLEDDTLPIESGWERYWIRATELWGHVSFAHKRVLALAFAGDGTVEDPLVSLRSSAQCSSVSANALAEVGYFDTRFSGFGIGHKEWTNRLKRAGYGTKVAIAKIRFEVKDNEFPPGTRMEGKVYIYGGLRAPKVRSHYNREAVERNRAIKRSLKRAPLFRPPWSNREDKDQLVEEMRKAGISTDLVKTIDRQVIAFGDSRSVI